MEIVGRRPTWRRLLARLRCRQADPQAERRPPRGPVRGLARAGAASLRRQRGWTVAAAAGRRRAGQAAGAAASLQAHAGGRRDRPQTTTRFGAFFDLLRSTIWPSAVRGAARGAADAEQARLLGGRGLDAWVDVWQAPGHACRTADPGRLHLDKRQALDQRPGTARRKPDQPSGAHMTPSLSTSLHADLLRERRTPYRPRLHNVIACRRDRAVETAGRLRRVLPDRDRRTRPEGREGGGRRRHEPAIFSSIGISAAVPVR